MPFRACIDARFDDRNHVEARHGNGMRKTQRQILPCFLAAAVFFCARIRIARLCAEADAANRKRRIAAVGNGLIDVHVGARIIDALGTGNFVIDEVVDVIEIARGGNFYAAADSLLNACVKTVRRFRFEVRVSVQDKVAFAAGVAMNKDPVLLLERWRFVAHPVREAERRLFKWVVAHTELWRTLKEGRRTVKRGRYVKTHPRHNKKDIKRTDVYRVLRKKTQQELLLPRFERIAVHRLKIPVESGQRRMRKIRLPRKAHFIFAVDGACIGLSIRAVNLIFKFSIEQIRFDRCKAGQNKRIGDGFFAGKRPF